MTLKLQKKDGGIEAKLYLNGVEQNNITEDPTGIYKRLDAMDTNVIENYIFYIGNRKNYNGYPNKLGFLGIIDEIKVYRTALSDEHIKQDSRIVGF